jgi:lactate dehydrogenase-like 2-hydroxyacid dehydrogenase
MNRTPVLLIAPQLAGLESALGAGHEVIRLWEFAQASELAGSPAAQARAAITIGGWGGAPEHLLAGLPALGLIACFGAGYDKVDLEACRTRGIAVTNCPAVNCGDVADVALWLMLDCVRGLSRAQTYLRDGSWQATGRLPGVPQRVATRAVGIFGLGAIGQAIATRAAAFGCTVRWSGPRPKPDAAWPYIDNLHALARASDVLFLTCPGGEETRGVVDADVLAALGPQGVVINVARGSVVDEDALIAALRTGAIAGAGLDVFATEPTPPDRWRDVPNIVLTPHLAGATRQSVAEQVALVVENIRRFHAGETLLGRVV